MMGQIIKLKKSKLFKSSLACCLLATALLTTGVTAAQMDKLPLIQQVGVIPVQWDKQTAESFALEQSRRLYESAIFEAASSARRFRILNSDLVSGMWSDVKGRQELLKQFELHAFLSVGSNNRGETIDMTARMLDPNLKTLLLETDTLSTTWFMQASKADLSEKAEELVYRIFNRIPVDVSITSIQGQYITLSGGAEQGILAGDSVDLVRTHINGLHPANGTWLSFTKKPVGKAKVIDVKKYSSVARLTELVKDNGVEVGDGARIPAIATRVKFARMDKGPEIVDAGPNATIVVPPLYAIQPGAVAQPQPALTQVQQNPGSPKEPEDEEDAAETMPAPSQTPAAAQENKGPSLWKSVASDVTGQKLIDHVTVYSGPQWWSVKGPTNSSGKFPVWILNSLGVQISRTLLFKIKTDFGGGATFGNTPHSNYLGYTSFANMYWEDDLVMAGGLVKKWRGGGYASFSGMSVPKGPYGGGDWVRGGGFIGFNGTFAFGPSETYDWFVDYGIMPLNIGRLGYSGKRQNVESSFGMKFSFGAFQGQQTGTLLYGGGIDIGDERMTLKNGRRPHFEDWAIKFLARYPL